MKRKTLTDNTNIDDLPEVLLVEILCRLPCNKLVFQCKCVSKRWFSLISSAQSFVGRYLCIQHELQKPINLTTLVIIDLGTFRFSLYYVGPSRLQDKSGYKQFHSWFSPMLSSRSNTKDGRRSVLSLDCTERRVHNTTSCGRDHKDLVLCCATKYNQRDYYLCNPYTKGWASLPPTPQVYRTVAVAFVCEPYYKCEQGSIILNSEYRWKAVRAVPNSSDPNFHLEIFCYENRQWRELAVLCSQQFSSFFCMDSSSVMACNGMLYWWRCDGFMLELDLSMFTTSTCSSGDHNIAKCFG